MALEGESEAQFFPMSQFFLEPVLHTYQLAGILQYENTVKLR